MATTQKILIVGTHYGVGKTIVSAIISKALGATYWKPIQCGSFDESQFIKEHTGNTVFEPVFKSFNSGLPFISIEKEGKPLKMPFKVPNVKPLVIETIGGALTPLSAKGMTLLDAFDPMEVDVVLVCSLNEDTINQVALNCHNLQWLGFNVLGIVYNGVAQKDVKETDEVIEVMTGVKNKLFIPTISMDNQSIEKQADTLKKELQAWIK